MIDRLSFFFFFFSFFFLKREFIKVTNKTQKMIVVRVTPTSIGKRAGVISQISNLGLLSISEDRMELIENTDMISVLSVNSVSVFSIRNVLFNTRVFVLKVTLSHSWFLTLSSPSPNSILHLSSSPCPHPHSNYFATKSRATQSLDQSPLRNFQCYSRKSFTQEK